MYNPLKSSLCGALLLLLGTAAAQAQEFVVDRTKYPDFTTDIRPDENLRTYGAGYQVNKKALPAAAVSERPDHVDNSQKIHFPPVFNQAGGSCGSASRICYMFTWELNAYRNLNGKLPENYYPSHFVWLLTNGNSGKDVFVEHVGVPSAAVYGGQTFSSLFGYQDTGDSDFGWMTGYDKWYSAMFNRMYTPARIPADVGSEAGREYLKNWLWNHNGDPDFAAGGVAGIGVASGGNWQPIGKTATNDAIGVTGKKYVKAWGTSVDHALTIVGYDDRIEFDLDDNGVYGERDKDEVGAWIVVNSWGAGWCNNGFVYCPYKHATPNFTSDGKIGGGYYQPEIYHVRKDYRPLRTIKVKMDYNRRSEIALSAGVSTNLNATAPDASIPLHHFQYAGDGHNGNSNPAPEVPMLGRWADGKLHDEPMEFGYDLTTLSEGFDRNQPLKYFFVVNTKSWAQGAGHIYEASIIDYKIDREGIETPFNIPANAPVEVRSAGNKTIISVIVYGEGYFPPQNAQLAENVLSWSAPTPSGHEVASYNIYVDGKKVGSTTPSVCRYSFNEITGTGYSISAVYADGNESQLTTVNAPVERDTNFFVYNFTRSGFSIPDVFQNTYSDATIEFWIRPTSLANWNQVAGPGWGTFMMHANSNGTFTFGWDTGDRADAGNALKVGTWTHVALVVNKNKMTCYINGQQKASFTSSSHSGLGGFGNLVFAADGSQNHYLDGRVDELRIWSCARTASQISANYGCEFAGPMLPDGLIAYFKGDTFEKDGKTFMREVAGGHHAEVLNSGFSTMKDASRLHVLSTENLSVSINTPSAAVQAGLPVTLTAKTSSSVSRIVWTCPAIGLDSTAVQQPTVTFPTAGTYTVKANVWSAKGKTAEAEKEITVIASPAIDAAFTVSKTIIPAGQHVTFIANTPVVGYTYSWSMSGANVERANGMSVGATYDKKGTYTVSLTVAAPDGTSATTSQQVSVTEVAPEAAFRVTNPVILKGEKTFLLDESKYAPTEWQWLVHSDAQDYIINGQNTSFTPDVAGVYDITLSVKNNSGSNEKKIEKALYVCNADSKNGLNFVGTPSAKVTTSLVPFSEAQRTFTIDFWLEQSSYSDFCDAIGDTESSLLLQASEAKALILNVAGRSVATPDGFLLSSGWHHYAVTFSSGSARFYRDGELISTTGVGVASVPAGSLKTFRIGGEDFPFQGRIDEFRVWGTSLTQAKIRQYCVAPIEDLAAAENTDKLLLYYDFNQGGGDVQDLTSHFNTGVRSGFGPDGDAWGLSRGVFALNFASTASSNVTSKYLKNYQKSFAHSSTLVNTSVANRFYAISNWTLENQTKAGNVTTGVHVDAQKTNCFTSTSGWDGFGTLEDHKAFQVLDLPAGAYTFKVEYDDKYEGQCGNSYLVAAKGTTLPNTSELGNAIAYKKMNEKSSYVTSNELLFVLDEPTKVSLGLLINQSGRLCMAIQKFSLTSSSVKILQADGAKDYEEVGIEPVVEVKPATLRSQQIYDLQGRRVQRPTRGGIYIIGGKKVYVK